MNSKHGVPLSRLECFWAMLTRLFLNVARRGAEVERLRRYYDERSDIVRWSYHE